MIHLYGRTYLTPNSTFRENLKIYEKSHFLYQTNQKKKIVCNYPIASLLLTNHWASILNIFSQSSYRWLIETTRADFLLKNYFNDFCFTETRAEPVTLTPDPFNFSFEHVLATFLLEPGLVRPVLHKKLEHSCWEQIIQEISVIRQEVSLLLFNQKINEMLPDGKKLDFTHPEEIEYQLYNHPYLSWLFDQEFTFGNVEYFKKNIDLEHISHFYDSWMLSRQKVLGKTPDPNLDNLKWITNSIKAKDWECLLDANLKRNFGCVYIDNRMINKANQVWGSALYRDFNRGSSETAKKLALKLEFFDSAIKP